MLLGFFSGVEGKEGSRWDYDLFSRAEFIKRSLVRHCAAVCEMKLILRIKLLTSPKRGALFKEGSMSLAKYYF